MRLLILGTGGMARQHAINFAAVPGVTLVAGVDTDAARAAEFATAHKIARSFGSLDEAIAWGEFDAAANVTPDSVHYATTMKLMAAGKHVFCEKPLAVNYPDARDMANTAEKAGLVNMVNLTYRNVAELQKARAMVLAGEVGTVRHIEAAYRQSWLVSKLWGDWKTEPQWLWRLSRKHGSNGCLGDTGIHILDFAVYGAATEVDRLFCKLRAFDKAPGGKIGEYVLDANDGFTMSTTFKNGAIGVIHGTRFATGHINELHLRVHGDKGAVEVLHTTEGSKLRACVGEDVEKAQWRDIVPDPVETNYQKFAAAVKDGKTREPSFRHAANLQRVLDLAQESDKRQAELAL